MPIRFGKRGSDRPTGEAKARVPPGQKAVTNWPVFTHGGRVPDIDLSRWSFSVSGLVEEELTFTWEEFTRLPQVTIASDIHCVTHWSRLDNRWDGVPAREVVLLARPKPEARFVMMHCYGGYTTNLRLDDLLDDDVLFALKHDGEPLSPRHGGPVRLVLPKLYFWKSAKWVSGMVFADRERPGFWETHGYHIRGDPWKEERYS